MPVGTEELDARGLRCPLPVIHLARLAAGLAPGSAVLVRWTDPAAAHDIPAWARMRGHVVVETRPPGDLTDHGTTLVRLGGDDEGPAPAGADPS
ncbi:sulfurtransferase TusA family protein [Cellulomonas sp. APG4]|uniref:sulfurtransferase TusA family protein n=1 Tax=Cellulomonas sp. APG4 TaxID=1538656 RepID=UPI00137A6884|nr:sulfurtransferase TusA family protein [Cellulomonas sp. APG4]